MPIFLSVNGKPHEVDVDPDTPLLWVLRDTIGLTGTKYGCGIAQCGACTVHINGEAQRSCQVAVKDVGGGQGHDHRGAVARQQPSRAEGVAALDVPQCGYCQSGMIMAVAALLKEKPKPTNKDIDERITNICRCGTYTRIRAAILEAAKSA